MLTEDALRERKWGRFPLLRLLLENKPLPTRLYGFTSVSDNILDRLSRLVEVSCLVEEHKRKLVTVVKGRSAETLHQELGILEDELRNACGFIKNEIENVHAMHAFLDKARDPSNPVNREFLSRVNIDLALRSGWEEIGHPEIEIRSTSPYALERRLLGRRFVLLLDDDNNASDLESGPLYVEACDATEEDLDAINEALERKAREGGQQLRASAVGLFWRFDLPWIKGSESASDLQFNTTVDYKTTLSTADPYKQIALDVFNSVSLQDLERNGWCRG